MDGGAAMPRVTFRGKTYNSEFEMPEDVRRDYQEYQSRKTSARPLTDIVDMPENVKAIYERAMDKAERAGSMQPSKDLPKTEDIYRQSAPDNLKHMPSDESVYRASPPVIDPTASNIEPEPSLSPGRLVSSVVWAVVLAVIVLLVMQFLA
jgi:hypothetical protein